MQGEIPDLYQKPIDNHWSCVITKVQRSLSKYAKSPFFITFIFFASLLLTSWKVIFATNQNGPLSRKMQMLFSIARVLWQLGTQNLFVFVFGGPVSGPVQSIFLIFPFCVTQLRVPANQNGVGNFFLTEASQLTWPLRYLNPTLIFYRQREILEQKVLMKKVNR